MPVARPADRAYAWIRRRILLGTFAPRMFLREEELASRMGVSRSPVRDALRRLAGEGLVSMERERGTCVAEFSPSEIEEIFRLRAELEAYGASLAARRAVSADVARLEALAARMEKIPGERYSRFAVLNNEFHLAILAAARSPRLAAMLTPLITIPVVLLKHYNWQPGQVDIGRSNRDHRRLIAALRARDAVGAARCIRQHILSRRPPQEPR